MTVLEVKDLTVTIGLAEPVRGVSFAVEAGERFGIIGESGSGKTLTALAVTGLLPEGAVAGGEIRLDGKALPADERIMARLRGRRIAMVFQEPMTALNPLMRVGAQITEAGVLAGRSVTAGTLEGLLSEVGLDTRHGRRFPHQLSGGQRQRVMIAMALAGEPALLIADEPTSALDVITQRVVLELIRAACTRRNMALVLISHDLKAVAALCSRIAVIRQGQIVESGPPETVFREPKHDYTKLLVAASRPARRMPALMRAMVGPELLEVRELRRRFRQPGRSAFSPRPPIVAVDGVSFSIRKAESVALVGPSGCGKTTLARLIAGLDRASDGDIIFMRERYRGDDLPARLRREISLVFQDPFGSFNPRLPIGDSVSEPLRLEREMSVEDKGKRLLDVIGAVGLEAQMLLRFPHEFSGGQRQRFAIARALITRPSLVVLDEPVSALDVSVRGEILTLLNRLRADFGLTYLIISHDLDMVAALADWAMVMEAGKIVEIGTPKALFETPKHALTRALVAARLPEIGRSGPA